MKALVLSGGSGVRFRPFAYSMPKQLMPVANRPVLEYAIANVRDIGVTEVALVVGGWADAIRDAIGDGARLGVHITYLRQDQPAGLAHAVRLARPFLGADEFVMYLGDNMLPEGVAGAAEDFRKHRPAAQLVLQKVADPRAFGVAEVDTDGSVVGLAEKPARPRSDLAVVGVYFFSTAIHAAVDAIEPSARGELEITDAIGWLLEQGARVLGREYAGYWKDVGRVEDVVACNRRLLDDVHPAMAGHIDAASELHGRIVVEPGARIRRSRIDGPAIIGAGTVVEGCRIGPGTSIGRDCRLYAAELSDSVVLDGARIRGVRIHESVIGRHTRVGPAGGNRTGHRLAVGDHSTIEIAE